MEPKVIFEDDDILVLEKPAGMVVNRAESVKEKTLQEWLEEKFKLPPEGGVGGRAGIVHRLDKETSGILLVAKTQEAFENLQKQFKERVVKKKYLSLAHGRVSAREGEIKAPVGRLPWNREKFGVLPGGREATTRFRVLELYTIHSAPYTLLELFPETGRTHQIRIHLKYLGHPVVGDLAYTGRKTVREDRKWCPRLFLHATFLQFMHPETGEEQTFESRLPDDLEEILRKHAQPIS
ncbi:RluA family pseudouridine synthase [Candidatus Microgenomates bacterium]|nr:RluA family pseudouridine synthase [Candidatus Microgenomates bacterium]